MGRTVIVLSIALAFMASGLVYGQSDIGEKTEKMGMDCAIAIDKRPNVAVFSLNVSAPGVGNGIGREIGERISAYLKGNDCYNLDFVPSHYIPKNAQAYISGNLKDFYTSDKTIGKPRLQFDLELRDATTQKILASTTIDLKGKLYMGIGDNKPFKAIFQEALEASQEFILMNRNLIPERKLEISSGSSQGSPYEEAVENAPGAIKRTESILDQMKDHSDKKRKESRNMYLDKQEYYNAPGEYKSLVETKGDEYLVFTVDGKKYETNKDYASHGLMTSANRRSSALSKVEIFIQDIKNSRSVTMKMMDPASEPTKRKFILGAKNGILNDGADERFWIEFKFYLNSKDIIEARYQVYNGEVKTSNIDEGYMNILFYEPQLRGVLDFDFDFVVKTKNGTTRNIKGRMRTRV